MNAPTNAPMNQMNAQGAAPTRGTVIKVPDASPGILFANGQQQFFTLAGVWKSPVAPAVNMTVDIEYDSKGTITAVTVVDPHQVSKERMNQLGNVAQEQGKHAAELAKQGVGALAGRMGAVQLGAAVVIVIAFFFLPAITFTGLNVSFWDALGFQTALGVPVPGSHGFLAILGLACIAAPFAVPFLKFPWAKYLNAAPLAIVIIGTLVVRSQLAGPKIPDNPFGRAAAAAMGDLYSFGWGLYILGLAALVLAFFALKDRSQSA